MQSAKTKPKRTIRVGGVIQEEISELLLRKIKDPRLEMVTISGVDVSPDLKQARVFFSRFGNSAEIQRSLEGLQSAAGFIKKELGQRLKLRHVPELKFRHDPSFEYGDRIESLIKDVLPAKEPVES
jgi:ribosome-binding factor A